MKPSRPNYSITFQTGGVFYSKMANQSLQSRLIVCSNSIPGHRQIGLLHKSVFQSQPPSFSLSAFIETRTAFIDTGLDKRGSL